MSNKILVIIVIVGYVIIRLPFDGTQPFDTISTIAGFSGLASVIVLIIRFCRTVSQLFKDVHTIAENSKREH